MIDSERPAFSESMAMACAVFRVEPDPLFVRGYWEALRDLPLAPVLAAFGRSVAECQHFPRPTELKRLAGVPSWEQMAGAEWCVVVQALRSWGDDPVVFDDARTHAAVGLLGWRRLGQASEDEMVWERRRFIEAWVHFAETGAPDDPAPHSGRFRDDTPHRIPAHRPATLAEPAQTPRLTDGGQR
jgi:hypothetical protein